MGLFGFGSKSKYVDEEGNTTPEVEEKKNNFFLDSDEAQTLGDIDYMRKSVKTRRTFPKTKSNPKGAEFVQEVSSDKAQKVSGANNASNNTVNTTPTNNANGSTANTSTSSSDKRKPDNNMDMFRNMARQMRK